MGKSVDKVMVTFQKANIALFLFMFVFNKNVCSSSEDWSGKFQDTTFGGYLYICLSEVTEADMTVKTVGQAMFSRLGYMRGDITGDVWNGEYYMAGLEARHGTFNFTLATDGLSYSGVFAESIGYSFGMSGNKTSIPGYVPKDTDCFKTDSTLLTEDTLFYNYTSNAVATNIARYLPAPMFV